MNSKRRGAPHSVTVAERRLVLSLASTRRRGLSLLNTQKANSEAAEDGLSISIPLPPRRAIAGPPFTLTN